MSKNTTITNPALDEAVAEIYEGKLALVKNHFQTLIGKQDGINARRANILAKIDKEISENDEQIAKFSAMSIDEAYNELLTNRTQDCSPSSNIDERWYIQSVDFDGYATYVK